MGVDNINNFYGISLLFWVIDIIHSLISPLSTCIFFDFMPFNMIINMLLITCKVNNFILHFSTMRGKHRFIICSYLNGNYFLC